jgi:hypothetical protein
MTHTPLFDKLLSQIKPDVPPTQEPRHNEETIEEQQVLELEEKRQSIKYRNGELEIQQEQIKNIKHIRELREQYHPRIWLIICWWLPLVATILCTYIIIRFFWKVDILPPSVFIALLGSTTLGILGLLAIILKYIYPSK